MVILHHVYYEIYDIADIYIFNCNSLTPPIPQMEQLNTETKLYSYRKTNTKSIKRKTEFF